MIATVSEPRTTLDVPALTGTWKNTNAASRGVTQLDIAVDGSELRISAQGWGSTSGHPYSVDGFDCREALAFNCVFDLGDRDVRLQANIKAGVLVIVFLIRFHDDRTNLFTREFYYRSAQ
jgi:hypothetical protein